MDKKKSAKAEPLKEVPASQDAKRSPVRTLREADCNASIWAREVMAQGAKRVFFSVTLERSFKDPTGQFRYTKTFDPESLPKIVLLCQKAQEAIDELQQRLND